MVTSIVNNVYLQVKGLITLKNAHFYSFMYICKIRIFHKILGYSTRPETPKLFLESRLLAFPKRQALTLGTNVYYKLKSTN